MNIRNSWIEEIAAAAIGDEILAACWLEQPSPLFGGVSPLEAMSTTEGRHRVRRQLTWFAGGRPKWFAGAPRDSGKPEHRSPIYRDGGETLIDLLSDPMMELVLARAGTGTEEFLKLCRGISVNLHAPVGGAATHPD